MKPLLSVRPPAAQITIMPRLFIAMKTKSLLFVSLLLPAFVMNLHAGPRSSTNYNVSTDTTDAGGKRATSAAYTNDASLGGVTGITPPAGGTAAAKSGYIGQLYDVTGLVVNASSLNVNETATLQLAAWHFLDDTSLLAVPVASVAWSVASGPITGISAGGLVTAGPVYQNTAATLQGTLGGFNGSLNLTVLDTIADNFGSYAGDGIGDDWQSQYFGLNNPNAAPGFISDVSGLTNLFKYTAGLTPGDATSRFLLAIAPVGGQPTQKSVAFGPVVAGRIYTLTYKTDLNAATWTPVPGATFTDSGTERTMTDPAATEEAKFYRIQILKP